jgi:biotin--protein ligase
VGILGADALLAGDWAARCALLVMPGGADLPYCRRLAGRGNALISDFVAAGGGYLGLCAGAYYAAARVDFEPGTLLEVAGPRELAFFGGTARGAAFRGFDYASEAGAVAAALSFAVDPSLIPLLAAGGGASAGGGRGSTSARPAAVPPAGSATGSGDSGLLWVDTLDYSNGGPVFAPDAGARFRVLARYAGAGRAGEIAAVRCTAGAGAAVLCGTHPELPDAWLDASTALLGETPAASSSGHGAAGPPDAPLLAHTRALQASLRGSQATRKLFFCMLLAAALRLVLPGPEGD